MESTAYSCKCSETAAHVFRAFC